MSNVSPAVCVGESRRRRSARCAAGRCVTFRTRESRVRCALGALESSKQYVHRMYLRWGRTYNVKSSNLSRVPSREWGVWYAPTAHSDELSRRHCGHQIRAEHGDEPPRIIDSSRLRHVRRLSPTRHQVSRTTPQCHADFEGRYARARVPVDHRWQETPTTPTPPLSLFRLPE